MVVLAQVDVGGRALGWDDDRVRSVLVGSGLWDPVGAVRTTLTLGEPAALAPYIMGLEFFERLRSRAETVL